MFIWDLELIQVHEAQKKLENGKYPGGPLGPLKPGKPGGPGGAVGH